MKPLVVDKIHKYFDDYQAVKGVSFEVEAGEVLGIVGPNGAGKTTTIKMILGLLYPDKGHIKLFNKSINDLSTRQKIGYMPETPSFYNHLTGLELLKLAGDLFGLPKNEILKRSESLLNRVGLEKAGNRALRGYSKGMLQRIGLAQALINQPALLFLDEPLDGLDPIGRIQMREILLEIKKQGTAIVLNSHILSDVEVMSDRIAIMNQGSLLKHEKVSELIPKGKTLEDVFIQTIEQDKR